LEANSTPIFLFCKSGYGFGHFDLKKGIKKDIMVWSRARFYLEFFIWGRSSEWPKATCFLGSPGACPLPPEVF